MPRGAMSGLSCNPRRTRWLVALALGPLLSEAQGLVEDQPAPEFRAVDLTGARHTLADFAGRVTLVLFWHPENALSRAAMCGVAKLASGRESALLEAPARRRQGHRIAGALQHVVQSLRRAPGLHPARCRPQLLLVGHRSHVRGEFLPAKVTSRQSRDSTRPAPPSDPRLHPPRAIPIRAATVRESVPRALQTAPLRSGL